VRTSNEEGVNKRKLSLPPSWPSLPANFWKVTRSEVPVHTFQRPKTLRSILLLSGLDLPFNILKRKHYVSRACSAPVFR
jgi:hypothetical protein